MRDYLDKNDLCGDADVISVAGGVRAIAVNDEHGRPYLEEQIDISRRLHQVQRVIIMHHTDCGAYGGRVAFASDEDERSRHFDDMHAVETLLRSKYEELDVELRLARIQPDGSVLIDHA
jgi:carbonic anhydrase